MDIAVLGIDLGKNSCSVVGLDGSGKVVLRRRMQRKTIVNMAERLSPCMVAMEACCGAHHLGRVLAAQGHTLRMMSPEYVRPYVKAQKNDDRDAEAHATAFRCAAHKRSRSQSCGRQPAHSCDSSAAAVRAAPIPHRSDQIA
jgi:transposase